MLLSASVKQRRVKPKKHKDEPCRRTPTRRLAKPKSDFALQTPPPQNLPQQKLASITCVLLAISQLTALILQPIPLKSQEPVPVWVQVTPLLSLVVAFFMSRFFSGVEFVRFGLQIEANSFKVLASSVCLGDTHTVEKDKARERASRESRIARASWDQESEERETTMGQEGDKFLAPSPARPGLRDRSSRAVLRPQPAARLVARDVPRARGWLELHDGREDSRKLESRLLLPLAEAEAHHVPVAPAREGARPQHPERVVPHLVVGHDAAAVARGHGRVQPVEVVVLLARRGEEDALLAPAGEQLRLLGSGRPARRVLLVQHEKHSRRRPLPPDALDRAQQPVHLLQVEELLAMRLRLAPPLRLADGGRGRVEGA
eukprot:CAMPEP_0202735666 /NCGR_PEP_ID=MMETSP1388-20130828/539_1 /ASSEMBLY_ACC=CAM_ASM_000864 /TAXON_ID=37098 /ORGANISM="Isochrysis sp, Strain CCMP1244" /LENGTH=373 /DNA_ID=CAMNT_0049402123 /DNA_START=37 /DNA_END=1155 /DNA_ORIENTATION=+